MEVVDYEALSWVKLMLIDCSVCVDEKVALTARFNHEQPLPEQNAN